MLSRVLNVCVLNTSIARITRKPGFVMRILNGIRVLYRRGATGAGQGGGGDAPL